MGRDRPQKKKKELCVWLKKKHPPPICCVSSSILQFFEDGGGWGSKIFFWDSIQMPNTHTPLFQNSLFFRRKKKLVNERPTNKYILMLLQTSTTTGKLDASSSSPSPSSRGSSRTNLAPHRPHGRSTRRAAVRANPFGGTNFTREEDRRKNNRHPRAPSSLCLSRNKKLNSLRTFRVKSEANDDGEFCTERVSRRFSCARALFCFLQLGLKGEEEPIDTFALYFIQSGKTREFFTERVSLTLSFSLSLFLRARQSPRRFSLSFPFYYGLSF